MKQITHVVSLKKRVPFINGMRWPNKEWSCNTRLQQRLYSRIYGPIKVIWAVVSSHAKNIAQRRARAAYGEFYAVLLLPNKGCVEMATQREKWYMWRLALLSVSCLCLVSPTVTHTLLNIK